MPRIFIYLFVGSIFITSCGPSKPFPKDSKIYGLASPVQLHRGSNTILFDDYFVEGVTIDSVLCDYPLAMDVDMNASQLTIILDSTTLPKLMNLSVFVEGIPYGILLKTPIDHLMHFRFYDGQKHSDVRVKGEFNNWNAKDLILNYDSSTGIWRKSIYLSPGSYQYKYLVDGIEMNDPINPKQIGNGMGGSNSLLEITSNENAIPNLVTQRIEKHKIFIGAENVNTIYAYWNNYRIEAKKVDDSYVLAIPPFAKYEKRSHVRVYACNETGIANDILIPLEKGKVITDPTLLNSNDWQSGIMYFMMVDRFADGDVKNNHPLADPDVLPKANYMGGDLTGITKKIEEGYFKDLGINTIWISPIAQNPLDAWGQFKDPDTKFSGYHGYWPISSSQVDYRFGTSEELKNLIEVAHNHGLSILLDYVANHVHQQHPVYQQHKDWVTDLYLPDGSLNTERWDDHRLTTWFDTFMPSLNLMDQKVADFMVDSAIYWVRDYDFDGFRHDATKHIPENFWRSLTKEVKKESMKKGKYIYQIGETYGSHELINSYVGSGMLDGQFDFNLYDHSLAVFAGKDENFERLAKALGKSLNTYGSHHMMGNISGNQDKPRFISFADGSLSFDTKWIDFKRIGWKQNIGISDSAGYDRLAMFNAFNMTIPGIPIIYYGDEIGLPGAGDPDNRRMMKFDNLNTREKDLLKTIAELTALRQANMALTYGDLNVVELTSDIFSFSRKYFSNEVFVVFNKGSEKYQTTTTSGKIIDVTGGDFHIEIIHN